MRASLIRGITLCEVETVIFDEDRREVTLTARDVLPDIVEAARSEILATTVTFTAHKLKWERVLVMREGGGRNATP